MKIKICGIRSKEDIDLVNHYKPDYIGFIFFKKSKRYIKPEEVLKLKESLNYSVKTVGVFVNEDPDYILDCFKKGVFDMVQLHGNEGPSVCKRLQIEGLPVIKALRVKSKEDIESSTNYDPDFFLFDVKSNKFVGGTGESFDWELLQNYKGSKPYFLAGGIGPDNISKALKTNAAVLDISSSVETNFKKDKDKINRLFENYRNLNV